MSMDGLLVLDKQQNISSAFAIRRFAKEFKLKKAGHAGTLDPMATGVLIAGIGNGTRILRFLESMDKVYLAELQLGKTTDTEDAEGDLLDERPVPELTTQKIIALIEKFVGKQNQTPPAFSAIKINGKRAYSLARKGEVVELSKREITIYRIDFLSYDEETKKITFRVKCSKGTYIRSLARDIGNEIGCGAHLTSLRRESIGRFGLSRSLPYPGELTVEMVANALIPISEALTFLPTYEVNESDAIALYGGKQVLLNGTFENAEDVYVKLNSGQAVCIAAVQKKSDDFVSFLVPKRMLYRVED
jgi:tRNA pseudouridine55 synthase